MSRICWRSFFLGTATCFLFFLMLGATMYAWKVAELKRRAAEVERELIESERQFTELQSKIHQ